MVDKLIKNKSILQKKVKSKFWFFLIIVVVILGLTGVVLFKMEMIFKPKPGSCLILEEKYCEKVVVNKAPNGDISSLSYLLPEGTILFAPESGNYSNTVIFNIGDNKNYGANILINGNNENDNYSYDFVYSKVKDIETRMIKKGEIFGWVSSKKLSGFTEYNLVVFVNQKKVLDGNTTISPYILKLQQLASNK